MERRITVIPGDGIGPEVVAAARHVVREAGVDVVWLEQHVGDRAGGDAPVPDAVVESIRDTGVALKGPVATSTSGRPSANVALRRALDLYVQVRPARSLPGRAGELPGGGRRDVDVVVVRETTEDLYRGIGVGAGTPEAEELARWLAARGLDADLGPETGFSIKPTSAAAVRRAAVRTLDWMRRHRRRHLTVVHKATVMRTTDGIFLDVVDDLASQVTDIEVDRQQVDAVCAQLIRDPARLDVLFMPNMYGDIVSDVAAALTGGVGTAPGANLGDDVAVFEAVHGTAPRHAGMGVANPLGVIRSASMMLAHVGELDASKRIDDAVTDLVAEGRTLTYDLLGSSDGAAGTWAVAEALAARLSR